MSNRSRRRLSIAAAALLVPATLVLAPTPATAAPTCRGKPATIVGTDGQDHLVGTARRDVIVAGADSDYIEARGGKDLVCGGSGADEIIGGAGADRLFGQADAVREWLGDTLVGGAGDDYLAVGDTSDAHDLISYAASPFRVAVDGPAHSVRIGPSTDRLAPGFIGVEGSRFADRMLGWDGVDYFRGGRGNDQLEGRGGADVILGYVGADVIRGGDGADETYGELGPDRLWSGPGGGDRMYGGFGADVLTGGAGDDVIYGYEQWNNGEPIDPDTVDAGGGDDRVITESNDDEVDLGPGDDTSIDRGGLNEITGGDGADWFQFNPMGFTNLDGGAGVDGMTFAALYEGEINVDLRDGWIDPLGPRALSFEIVHATVRDGSIHVIGSDADEVFDVRAYGDGHTLVYAGGGDDDITTGPGADDLRGGPGTDSGDAGDGDDTCTDVEQPVNCETVG